MAPFFCAFARIFRVAFYFIMWHVIAKKQRYSRSNAAKGHDVSLSIVSSQLNQWASSAALKAVRANDPDSIAALERAAADFRSLMAAVEKASAELEDCKRRLAAAPARKAVKVLRTPRMGAFEFWHQRRLAVEAIGAVYGENWGIKAPIGETVLVTVPPCWRSATTKRGTRLTWNKDGRMPAGRYWPAGKLPAGLEVSQDYPRAQPEDRPHDAAWHRAHGYAWNGSAWVHEVEIRSAQNRAEAIEAYNKAKRLAGLENAAMWYGPQRSQDEVLHQAHEQVWDGNFARETELMAAE